MASEMPDFSLYTASAMRVLIEEAGLSTEGVLEKAELRELANLLEVCAPTISLLPARGSAQGPSH